MASVDQLTGGRFEDRDLEKEMRSSFLDYAMSVIVSRALPDVRDGLKPVHRRVLYAMNEAGLQPNRPLVDGQGNFGNIDDDPAAAYRYTECRLARMATELLRDIDADTVDFVPNYDEKHREPNVLPSRFPNLLVNGSAGIAVGMATNIPPHNLGEVVDALVAMGDEPGVAIDRLTRYVKGPDFPTGAIVVG